MSRTPVPVGTERPHRDGVRVKTADRGWVFRRVLDAEKERARTRQRGRAIQFRVSDDDHARLQAAAGTVGESLASIARDALFWELLLPAPTEAARPIAWPHKLTNGQEMDQ